MKQTAEALMTADDLVWPDPKKLDSWKETGEKVLVRKRPPEKETKAGIALVESARKAHQVAVILAVGAAVPPGTAEIGEFVMFRPHAFATCLEIDDKGLVGEVTIRDISRIWKGEPQ